MKTKIDYNRLLSQFRKEYNFLYDNQDHVAGYSEAVEFFDQFIKTASGREIIGKFATLRQDIITSDREAAAFMFALDSMTA
jgi:hypothetical protein